MYKITCDYCFEDNLFENPEKSPRVCVNCNSPIGHLEMCNAEDAPEISVGVQKQKKLDGLILVYEKTNEWIEIPHSEIIILGRQSTGKDVLGNIPQISREHCKIEYFDGHYLITDLNSLNGTYLGQNKRDCHKHLQEKIKDNDLIFLGKEPFRVQFKYKLTDEVEKPDQDVEEVNSITKFKCRACGKIHSLNLLICDSCGSYGQVEMLTD